MHEAQFWETKEDDKVFCRLCPQKCIISEGRTGFCRVRLNKEGKLYTLNYGKCTSYGFDPIEKKPLYHFYPGSDIFSVGTYGCNLKCGFCQNWSIAHADPEAIDITPEALVKAAQDGSYSYNSVGIAYTYSEPLMWYEFIHETAIMARESGLKNVLVTNGYVNPEPLKKLLPLIDAVNIDVKGFSNKYYKETCFGELEPVLETVKAANEKCHVEITTLLVTGLNDSDEEISRLADWIASISEDIPLHLSRYFPQYKMNLPPTPLDVMERVREIALDRLNYVYLGNIGDSRTSSTFCPSCGLKVIARSGYGVINTGIEENKCTNCGKAIKLIGQFG